MILSKNQKKIIFLIGLTLVISALIIWIISIIEIKSNELILTNQNLTSEERWKTEGVLLWWKNFYSMITIPTIIFFLSGIIIMLSQKLSIRIGIGSYEKFDLKLSIPPKISSYLKTKNARWYWIVLFLAATTILVVYGIPENSYPLIYLRYVFGGVFTLWLPGYTFIKTLFPKKELDMFERIALSMGMSLAIVPLILLLLDYTTLMGINTNSVIISLLAFTMIFATISIIREYRAKLSK